MRGCYYRTVVLKSKQSYSDEPDTDLPVSDVFMDVAKNLVVINKCFSYIFIFTFAKSI